jgi:hypothetical protein
VFSLPFIKEMIYLILGLLALVYLLSLSTWEHMTNKDIDRKEKHHKTAKDWKPVKDPIPETAIRGPKAPELDPNEPDPAVHGGKGSGVYPKIYGPDILDEPGKRDSMPANEFPAGPDAPEPFLTDFSKLLT